MRMQNIKPNLFIIGSMKSGTTALHDLVGAHPLAYMSTPKEPMHFAHSERTNAELADYLKLFASAGGAVIVGESSTGYAKHPKHQGVAERLYEFNPAAKIIMVMRDPVQRALSHYWFDWRKNAERRPMLDALEGNYQYVSFSNYALQLEPYFRLFGPDAILTLTTEALKSDQARTLDAVFSWLGLPPHDVAESIVRNVRPGEMLRAGPDGLAWKAASSRGWKSARSLIPERARRAARRTMLRPFDPKEVATAEAVEMLRSRLLEPTGRLQELLGQDFPEWTTLYGD